MTLGSTIKIYLANGTAEGLKIIEKSNWTGKACACSRAQFPNVKTREEFNKPGVYVLVGEKENSENDAIYIGEGDPVLPRIESHLRNKDFWTRLIVFSSKDANLNKAHIQYLESKLIRLAIESKRYDVENGNSPLLPALSEPEIAEMEHFLSEMLVVYSILGISAFEIPRKDIIISQGFEDLILKIDETSTARGADRPEGFIVFSGSKGKGTESPSFAVDPAKKTRNSLIEKGIFKIVGNYIEVTQDYVFTSPSSASATLLGRSSNGRIDWKNSSGKTLKELQESK